MPELDEDALLTAAEAARVLTRLRDKPVSRHTVYNWVSRYTEDIQPVDSDGPRGAPRYRLGDLLVAEKTARQNDLGMGRGRPKAA